MRVLTEDLPPSDNEIFMAERIKALLEELENAEARLRIAEDYIPIPSRRAYEIEVKRRCG